MNLNPGQLATFAKVAAEGSFSGAAAALSLTQLAVSNQMNQLSRSLGEPLFTRHRLRVNLTPAGLQLLPHAQALLRALESAGTVASELRGLDTGTVRVAASTTIASYLLPAALARYRRVHPNLSVRQFVGNSWEVVAQLEAGGVDLALVEGPVSTLPQNLECQVLRYDEIALITLPDHPLAGEQCDPADLAGLEVVWREKGSGTREATERPGGSEARRRIRARWERGREGGRGGRSGCSFPVAAGCGSRGARQLSRGDWRECMGTVQTSNLAEASGEYSLAPAGRCSRSSRKIQVES